MPRRPTVELLNAPSLDVAGNRHPQDKEGALIDFHIDAQVDAPPEHTGGLFSPLKGKIRLTMKYQALIRPIQTESAKLGIYMLEPDLKTLQVHDSSLTWTGKLFKDKVISTIREVLSSESDCGSNGPLAEFELINSLWGVPLDYSMLKMDSQGQLMLYMNYRGRSYPSREGL